MRVSKKPKRKKSGTARPGKGPGKAALLGVETERAVRDFADALAKVENPAPLLAKVSQTTKRSKVRKTKSDLPAETIEIRKSDLPGMPAETIEDILRSDMPPQLSAKGFLSIMDAVTGPSRKETERLIRGAKKSGTCEHKDWLVQGDWEDGWFLYRKVRQIDDNLMRSVKPS